MNSRIKDAFDGIKAEEELKQSTSNFLNSKLYSKQKKGFARYAVAFAAIAVIFFTGFMGHNIYFAEAGVIDIDVNPSIGMSFNDFGRVISTHAYNEEGSVVLENADVRHKTYTEALEILIAEMIAEGYVKDRGMVTATLQKEDNQRESEMLDAMKSCINDALPQENSEEVEKEIFAVDSATKEAASEENLTPAKYMAIVELQEVDPTVTFETCRNSSISEIKGQMRRHMNGRGRGKSDEKTSGAAESEAETEESSSAVSEASQSETESHEKNGMGNGSGNDNGMSKGDGAGNGTGKGNGMGNGGMGKGNGGGNGMKNGNGRRRNRN